MCFVGGFVTMLDVSIVTVALPSIQTALLAGPTQLQLIVAGYALAFGLLLVPFGRLGDVYGRRRIWMIAIAGFGAMSLASGLSQTDTQLAIFRLLQGASAGMATPQTSGMIQQMFRGKERAKAFGFFGAVIGVSTALGPLIGGLILAAIGPEAGWRWIFFINVPICLIVLPLAQRLLPPPPSLAPGVTRTRTRLDIIGLVFIGLGTATFMAPFVTTPSTGFCDNPSRWLWLVPAFLLAPATYFWERHYQQKYQAAVLNPALIQDRSFTYGAALGAAYFAGFTALMLVLSLMLQTGLGFTALIVGLTQLPYAVASGITASQSGRLVPVWGRKLVVLGLSVGLVGLFVVLGIITFVPTSVMVWALGGALFIMGAGNGVVISPNQALSFQDVSPSQGSVAGAVLQVGQRTGTAVGMAIILAIYLSIYSSQTVSLGSVAAARHASTVALGISSVFLIAALVIGIVDMRRRQAL